jgi:hypothetical protein
MKSKTNLEEQVQTPPENGNVSALCLENLVAIGNLEQMSDRIGSVHLRPHLLIGPSPTLDEEV